MIIIRESKIRFKNPQIGQPTRTIEEHYYGRTILAEVNGQRMVFSLKKDEIPFFADEDDMILAVEQHI